MADHATLAIRGFRPSRPHDASAVFAVNPMCWVDVAIACIALFSAVLIVNYQSVRLSAGEVLELRITVKNLLVGMLFASIWVSVLDAFRCYRPLRGMSIGQELARGFAGCTCGSFAALLFPLTSRGGFPVRGVFLFWLIACSMWAASRLARRCVSVPTNERQVLIIGTGPLAQALAGSLSLGRSGGPVLAGFVDDEHSRFLSEAEVAGRCLGGFDQLDEILTHRVIDEVWLGLPLKSMYGQAQRVVDTCSGFGIEVKQPSQLFRQGIDALFGAGGGPCGLLTVTAAPNGPQHVLKRCMDIGMSLALLVALAPFMLIIAAAIKATSRGPVFYVQSRFGLNKRLFPMLKFRTMVEAADELQTLLEPANEACGPVFKIKNDPRVTAVGRLLRRTSLDELPQLFNVLAGQMSLVGPRPLPIRDVERFKERRPMRRFSVRPGITGSWQVSGRSDVDFERWMELDLSYIDAWSLMLDVRILLRTIPAVIRGVGAY